jgi:3-phenylpropionate/cinnamic acid dioxygenase small subunit
MSQPKAEHAVPITLEDMLLQHQIEQFLYAEAALLDNRQFEQWLELLAEDLQYWMPIRSTRSRADQSQEFTEPGQVAFFDDDKPSMCARVRKLGTGYSWSEDPPSRTRRLLSNIQVLEKTADESARVACNFLIYRSRLARHEDLWAGRREDILRRIDRGWEIKRRHIFLDHVSLDANNISFFF